MKGVAMLFMLWLHCFNTSLVRVQDYADIFIGDGKLCDYIARCTGPVELYILLSGYGLYITYDKTHCIDPFRRVSKLMILYWLSLLLFLVLGSIFAPGKYPGSISDVLLNFSAWNTTYNSTIWFLFPYVCLVFASGTLLKFLNKKPLLTLTAAFIGYVVFYGLSWATHHNLIHIPYSGDMLIKVLNFHFPFLVGATLCKYNIVERVKVYFCNKQLLCASLLLIISFLRSLTDFTYILHLAYSVVIICLITALHKNIWIEKILKDIGSHSTAMWFVHAYFIWYLFGDYFYSHKYPPFIFLSLCLLTYISSVCIDFLNSKIQTLIFRVR